MSKKFRLLYVDDDEENLLAFKAVFRRHYQITTLNSPKKALEQLEEESFDLVISDQRMPDMNGSELLELVQQKHPDSLRMLMTGYSDLDAIIDAINRGKIYYYISKPWQADQLKIILDRALETYRLKMENQELNRQNLLAQFEVLKNQVNPHFMFNSLNVLKSLIPIDQDKAIEFTDRFSQLYRAMLSLRDQKLISLQEELDFVDKYLYLQQTRFAEALNYKVDVDDINMDDAIPPFAIQLTVENCIKHNVMSIAAPLTIAIRHRGAFLEVVNNLQKREARGVSTGVGIQNLLNRYRMLDLALPRFHATQEEYRVELPVVASS